MREGNVGKASVYNSFSNKKQRLALKVISIKTPQIPRAVQTDRHNGRHSESELHCAMFSYWKGGLRPGAPWEVIYIGIERPFHAVVNAKRHFHVFVNETTRDTCVRGLKTRHAAANGRTDYVNEIARDGIEIKCISEDRARDLWKGFNWPRDQVKKLSAPDTQCNELVNKDIYNW